MRKNKRSEVYYCGTPSILYIKVGGAGAGAASEFAGLWPCGFIKAAACGRNASRSRTPL
jgi:hypothetical protein